MLDDLSLSATQRNLLESSTALYEQNVDMVGEFLADRGLSRVDATSARVGFVAKPAVPEHARFTGMMSLSYLTPAGVVAIKFRNMTGVGPKYAAPTGQRVRMYNVMALHSPGTTVAICEGELDALVMERVVGIPAVGVPGVSQWSAHPWWARVFADYERVLMIADHDLPKSASALDDNAEEVPAKEPPGQQLAAKVEKSIGARVILPPPGLDLSDWVKVEGPDAVRKACNV